MPRKRTHEYNDDEVQQYMTDYNIDETEARKKIYYRDWYRDYYEQHRDERLEYFKQYRKDKKK